jgi:amphi-Trp domain-containing protein
LPGALASGDEVELDLGGSLVSLRVADDVRTEFEIEVDGDEIEVEVELKWSTTDARAGAGPSEQGAEAPEHPTGKPSRRG